MIKKVPSYWFCILLNIAPFFLSCLLYRSGYIITGTFPHWQLLIMLLNFVWVKRMPHYLLLNLTMLVSSLASLEICVRLYYNNVSSDMETLMVGHLELLACLLYISVLTLISVFIRVWMKSKNKQQTATVSPKGE